MVNTYKSYNFDPETPLPKGYQGRSARDEYLYGGYNAFNFGNMRRQNERLAGNIDKNRNFSALNLNNAQKNKIINDSYYRNNLVPPNLVPSNRQPGINAANNRFSAISDKGGSVTPPNFKNNLLDYILSPKGKGMAQGLLEASGYSDTPVTFGQALAMGIKRGNEAEASAATSQLARDKFNYQKEQDILNRALEYAKISDVNVPALQQNISAMLQAQGLKPGTPEYDVAFANEIQKYLSKSSGTKVDIKMEAENKGTEQMYVNAANRNDAAFTKIQETSQLASDQNISIDSMMRIMRNMDESDFGTFGTTKLYLKQFAKQLGLNPEDISSAEVFYSLAGDFVMGQIAKTKGAISNKEMAYFEMISPGLSRSKQGNILQLQLAKEVNKFHIDLEEKRADFAVKAADAGWDSIKTEAEWIKESKKLYSENKVIGNLEKKMENSIINQAYNEFGKDNLLFNPRNTEDNTYINDQIQAYYDEEGSTVEDIKLVGYTKEGFPEYMVDLGNDRYELRTIKKDLRKE